MYRPGNLRSPAPTVSKTPMTIFGIVTMIALLVIAGVGLYFLYKILFASKSMGNLTTIAGGEIVATKPPPSLTKAPVPYEGGDYTISFWLYVNSYNVNRNTRKHIIDIGGANFSTVLIALGAFKNTLVVRTHSREASSAVAGSDEDAANLTPVDENLPEDETPPEDEAPPEDEPPPDTSTDGFLSGNRRVEAFQTPNSQTITHGSLTTADKTDLLAPMALDDGLLNSNSMCDLNEIDFQRWNYVAVVLSGRTVDVYIDGKLARSCISSSYYKVDPTGVKATMLANGGFDGYLSNVKAMNSALNPSEIYTIYTKGPTF